MLKSPFSKDAQERIREAVAAAEGHTSGEIVPYYVSECDTYQDAIWRGGLVSTMFSLVVSAVLLQSHGAWSSFEGFEALGLVFVSLIGGMLLAYIPFLRRFFVGKDILERRVQARALEAFVSEEVFDTKDRTGILIFMSMFERQVVVIGDSGINARVSQEDWNEVVNLIRTGMKEGKPTDGLVKAIQKCGQLLEAKGVEIQDDDTNELSDNLRMGE